MTYRCTKEDICILIESVAVMSLDITATDSISIHISSFVHLYVYRTRLVVFYDKSSSSMTVAATASLSGIWSLFIHVAATSLYRESIFLLQEYRNIGISCCRNRNMEYGSQEYATGAYSCCRNMQVSFVCVT